VRYTLKTPYRNGTTHVVFAPLDFMARLAGVSSRCSSLTLRVVKVAAVRCG
jgi:hypothetical protein